MNRINLEKVRKFWSVHLGGSAPDADLFKYTFADRWVRFHTLPKSKRYPDSQAEYEIILHRQNTLLKALDQSGPCYLITTCYTLDPKPEFSFPLELGCEVLPWMSSCDDSEPDDEPIYTHTFISQWQYCDRVFDPVLRLAIDDEVRNLMILGGLDSAEPWLSHPYDGGVDLILASLELGDRLKAQYAAWLSHHPQGL